MWQIHGIYAYIYDIYHMYMIYMMQEQSLCIIHHDMVRLYAAEAHVSLMGPDRLCPWLQIVRNLEGEALVLQALQQHRSYCACRRQNASLQVASTFTLLSLSSSNKLSQMLKERLCNVSVLLPAACCTAQSSYAGHMNSGMDDIIASKC